MKIIKIVSIFVAISATLFSSASAQGVIVKSYADVFPATESRLQELSSVRKIENTAVASVLPGTGSFAFTVTFPVGTTSAVFSVAQHVRSSKINGGIVTIAPPGVISIAQSKFNPEGETVSFPSLFYRNSEGVLIVPVNSNFVGTALVNPRTVFITEQTATLAQLGIPGDYWEVSRTVEGTFTINGVVFPFSFTNQNARVEVVDETDAPIAFVTNFYPNNPTIDSVIHSEGGINLTASGLTVNSYLKSWWMETSTDLEDWNTTNLPSVAPDVVISFPINPEENKRFYRVRVLNR